MVIVHRAADDPVHAQRLDLGGSSNETGKMRCIAGGRERPRDGKKHNPARAKHNISGAVGGTGGINQLDRNRWDLVARLDHAELRLKLCRNRMQRPQLKSLAACRRLGRLNLSGDLVRPHWGHESDLNGLTHQPIFSAAPEQRKLD